MASSDSAGDVNMENSPAQPIIDRRPVAQPITAVEMYRLAKIDYFTGQFDSADLAAKYSTTRMMFVTQIKPKQPEGNGWFAEALALNIRPKPESPMAFRKLDIQTILKIRSDLFDGMHPNGVAEKYRVQQHKIKGLISKYGWAQEIRKRRAERNQQKIKLPEPAVEQVTEQPAEPENSSPDEDIGSQMREFIKAASMQIKFLTGEIAASNARKEKMSARSFQDTMEKFCQIAEAIKKMKSAAPSEMSGAGGSGRLIRPGVLADGWKSATDMAPTISRPPQSP